MAAALTAPARNGLRARYRRHPELPAALVVVAAWAALAVLSVGVPRGDGPQGAAARAMSGMAMPGLSTPGASTSSIAAAVGSLGGLPAWMLMAVAMMGPVALAGIRHTAVNSLGWRRGRAMAEYAAAYFGAWALFGAAVLAAWAPAARVAPRVALFALTLGAAACWQRSPAKLRALRACHRSVPLPPRGRKALRGALRFGWANGLACVRSCWCLMLVTVAAPGWQLAWTVVLTAIVASERLSAKPLRLTRWSGAALGITAVAVAAGAVAAAR